MAGSTALASISTGGLPMRADALFVRRAGVSSCVVCWGRGPRGTSLSPHSAKLEGFLSPPSDSRKPPLLCAATRRPKLTTVEALLSAAQSLAVTLEEVDLLSSLARQARQWRAAAAAALATEPRQEKDRDANLALLLRGDLLEVDTDELSQQLHLHVHGPEEGEEEEESGTEGQEDGKLYCLCRAPFDSKRFMLGCDTCDEWYHGDCVGITEEQADALGNYVCPPCASRTTGEQTPTAGGSVAEAYCLCRQPFDPDRFMLACDYCDEWYHGECVGITEEQAEALGNYRCPRCGCQVSQPGDGAGGNAGKTAVKVETGLPAKRAKVDPATHLPASAGQTSQEGLPQGRSGSHGRSSEPSACASRSAGDSAQSPTADSRSQPHAEDTSMSFNHASAPCAIDVPVPTLTSTVRTAASASPLACGRSKPSSDAAPQPAAAVLPTKKARRMSEDAAHTLLSILDGLPTPAM